MTYNFLLKRGFSEVLGYLITLLSTQKTGNFNQDGRLYVSCREFPKKYLNCLILLALNVNLLNFVWPIIFGNGFAFLHFYCKFSFRRSRPEM